MSAHTPGPWKAKGEDGKYDNRRNSWTVYDDDSSCSDVAPITLEDGTIIAFAVTSDDSYFPFEDRVDANAKLISAAPDLLEALKSARAFISHNAFPGAISIIDAAISKAVGP